MQDSTARRRRRSRYPSQIAARVAVETKTAIEALADRMDVDVAEAVRQCVQLGLPLLEGASIETEGMGQTECDRKPARAEEVNAWWQRLSAENHKLWRKRLAHIADKSALRAEAYRQAMAGKGR